VQKYKKNLSVKNILPLNGKIFLTERFFASTDDDCEIFWSVCPDFTI